MESELSFSERLKSLRQYHGMTMKEVSKRLNLQYTTYTNYEYGTREPDFQGLKSIASLFEVSTDFLLGFQPVDASEQVENDWLEVGKHAWLLEVANSPEAKSQALKTIWTEIRKL